jgi:hypothetical protein
MSYGSTLPVFTMTGMGDDGIENFLRIHQKSQLTQRWLSTKHRNTGSEDSEE